MFLSQLLERLATSNLTVSVCSKLVFCRKLWAGMKVKMLVTRLLLTLCNPLDCSPADSSVYGILQARIPEWVAVSFSRGCFWPKDGTRFFCIADRFFTTWATREIHGQEQKWWISGFVYKHEFCSNQQALKILWELLHEVT